MCNHFLTHRSSVGRFASYCNCSVAMENQHALRESVRNLNVVTDKVAQLDFSFSV